MDIKNILNKITRHKILVVGDAILDFNVFLDYEKKSQEADINVYRYLKEDYSLGGACNVATNLKLAKQDVSFASVVGLDYKENIIATELEDYDINYHLIRENNRKTTLKTRYYSLNHEQIFRFDDEDTFDISKESVDQIISFILDNKPELIVISDYHKGVVTPYLLEEIKKLNIKVVIDPKSDSFEKYKGFDVIKPNLLELKTMTNKSCESIEEIEDVLKEVSSSFDIPSIFVTLGDQGAIYFNNNKAHYLSAFKEKKIDVSGAGDSVLAYLAVSLVNNLDEEETLTLTNYVGSKKVKQKRATPVDINHLTGKIVDIDKIDIIRQKHPNSKIVFTNGCFDLFHAGHLYSLKEASKLGDILVVGVNSDSSIKRLKGNNRPIVSLNERLEILENLVVVDYLIPFDDDTPLKIIEKLIPDVLVKGEEYKDKEVVGSDIVINNGGKVILIPMKEGYSTTNMIKIIKDE